MAGTIRNAGTTLDIINTAKKNLIPVQNFT